MFKILIDIIFIGFYYVITILVIYFLLIILKLIIFDKFSMYFILSLIVNSFIIEGSRF